MSFLFDIFKSTKILRKSKNYICNEAQLGKKENSVFGAINNHIQVTLRVTREKGVNSGKKRVKLLLA